MKDWEALYHARKWGKLTWKQLFALFHKTHGYWPSWSWPYMPLQRVDMALRVRDTPPERLRLPHDRPVREAKSPEANS